MPDKCITLDTFTRLRYDRSTERYRYAVALARLIILNYQPDVRAGREDVLAILFNMNELFEAGKVKPVIDGPFPFRKIPDALRYFGEGRHKGKIVITLDP